MNRASAPLVRRPTSRNTDDERLQPHRQMIAFGGRRAFTLQQSTRMLQPGSRIPAGDAQQIFGVSPRFSVFFRFQIQRLLNAAIRRGSGRQRIRPRIPMAALEHRCDICNLQSAKSQMRAARSDCRQERIRA